VVGVGIRVEEEDEFQDVIDFFLRVSNFMPGR
jgi:hypothetical protein